MKDNHYLRFWDGGPLTVILPITVVRTFISVIKIIKFVKIREFSPKYVLYVRNKQL